MYGISRSVSKSFLSRAQALILCPFFFVQARRARDESLRYTRRASARVVRHDDAPPSDRDLREHDELCPSRAKIVDAALFVTEESPVFSPDVGSHLAPRERKSSSIPSTMAKIGTVHPSSTTRTGGATAIIVILSTRIARKRHTEGTVARILPGSDRMPF